jgi:hypothetical protein
MNNTFHIFSFYFDGKWHRTSHAFDDESFDKMMDMLNWEMPYNMRAFHFNNKDNLPVSNNPVFLAQPIIDVDLGELFLERVGVKLMNIKQEAANVLRLGSGFAIVRTNDNYGRLLKYSNPNELCFNEYYPIPFAKAREFVNKHHRHNVAPQSHKFSIGLLQQGILVGVIIASTPKAKAHDDRFTLELNRCCVLPKQPNACSKLYSRAISAGRNMGYKRFITYTLKHESGSSLKAVGFKLDGITQARPNGWHHPSRPRRMAERYPTEPKNRWILQV